MARHTKKLRRLTLASAAGLVAGISSLLALSATAYAETEVGIFGGYKFFSTDNPLSRARALDTTNSAGCLGYGAAQLRHLRRAAGVSAHSTNCAGSRSRSQPVWHARSTQGSRWQTRPDSQASVAVMPLRAHVRINILTGSFRPFLLVGGGGQLSSPLSPGILQTDTQGALHAGAGFMFDVRPSWGFRVDGRFILAQGNTSLFTPEGEILGAVFARFGKEAPPPPPPPAIADTDSDGILDNVDRCPTQAGLAANGGCPEVDSDSDGVADSLDKCPGVAGVKENNGCPDADGDGDGVPDRLDLCPGQAGSTEDKGCPAPDTDKDGINDRMDKCPQQPGIAELAGCPDTDQDQDGIPDRLDRCPDKAETRNSYQDDDGCPDELPQAVKKFTGAIAGISFQPNSAVIAQPSFKVLDQAVKVLAESPSVRLEISGHTDSSGDAAKNLVISQQRAEAVVKYLVSKGIAENRLVAKGYGPEKPVAPNTTSAGRSQNRRVEFTLLP
jgi:outer membrane protein OmpA-like peptidoglycan-associated protein